MNVNIQRLEKALFDSLVDTGIPESKALMIAKKQMNEVARRIGGVTFYISKMAGNAISKRNKSIKEDREKGLSITDLAIKYKYSERWIHSILSK